MAEELTQQVKPAPEKKTSEKMGLYEAIGSAKSSADKIAERYGREAIAKLGEELGISTQALSIPVIVDLIRDVYKQNKERSEAVGEEYMQKMSSPARPYIDKELAAKEKWGIKCPKCGDINCEFQPGFNPRRALSVAGRPIPFWMWPLKFRGPVDADPYALATRPREKPTCAFCNLEMPLERDGYGILGRVIVSLAHELPKAEAAAAN
jgi:hypothetical protein